ncbi:hypothetical protein GJAV_G00087660 [Gymnothorax javanicus]|nr:hypothetical protein GJAV_G00087660 [Gymnothorax javanicus]
MMQAGVRLRQDTETTLPELLEQHRIREKEEELHGLESVVMAESEIKCTAPGLNTLEPECVTANSRVSDLHHTDASLIKTETDLCPISSGVLKTERLDFTDLAYATHPYPDKVKTETVDGDYIKTELVSILPDIKCVYTKSDEDMFESSEVSGSDLMSTVLTGAGVDEKGETELHHCAGEPNPNCKISGKNQVDLMPDEGIPIMEKPDQCFTSGKCFFWKSDSNGHLGVHTGDKPFKRQQCEKRSAHQSCLNYHQKKHTGEKPYKCDQCGKSFSDKSHLQQHNLVLTGERPHICDQCGKSFARKSLLNNHQRQHIGEKPFKCDQCGRSFSRRTCLQRHERVHTGEKPYICDQCGKSFREKAKLRRHEKIHTGEKPYKCDQCGMSFSRKYSLQCHKKIHTGEKPYKCDQCGKSFREKAKLRCHEKIHTGEKP